MKTILKSTLVALFTLAMIPGAQADNHKGKHGVSTKESFIKWTGYGVGKSHWGHVSLSKADIKFVKNEPVSGEIIVDLKTIATKDIENPEWAGKLNGHLMNEDFFDVTKFPQAKFVATKITKKSEGEYIVEGKLHVKNKEMKKTLTLKTKKDGKKKSLVGTLSFDRTKFDVKYNSKSFFSVAQLKDKAIEDKIDLEINLMLN